VDGKRFTSRNVADDALAREWGYNIARGKPHVALTLDGDGVVITKDAAHHAGDAARFPCSQVLPA